MILLSVLDRPFIIGSGQTAGACEYGIYLVWLTRLLQSNSSFGHYLALRSSAALSSWTCSISHERN
jgi:hypothetical protein